MSSEINLKPNMLRVSPTQKDVINRAKSKANTISFKVPDKTLVAMIRSGLIEHCTQTEPYFLEYYRLTDKAINLQ